MAATWRGDADVARSQVRDGGARHCPRCAPRSTACGRCSRRRSCCTTCSVRWRCCGSPPAACSTTTSTRRSTGRAPRRSTTCGGRRPTSPCSTTPARCSVRGRGRNGKVDEADEIRTYGHIVIDEVQDLTPMQLKMATRRSLNGSMTVVGDIAQATGRAGARRVGTTCSRTCPTASRAPRDRAVGRLPDPGPDHGARQPGDGGRHARPAGADIGPDRRRRAADRRGRRR